VIDKQIERTEKIQQLLNKCPLSASVEF